MNWSRLRGAGSENVFKGSQLVSSILERHPSNFRSRATVLKFCRQLFNDGIIRGVFGADSFEDSVQLYTWKDENGKTMAAMPVNSTKSENPVVNPNTVRSNNLNAYHVSPPKSFYPTNSQNSTPIVNRDTKPVIAHKAAISTNASKPAYGYSGADVTLTKRELLQQKNNIKPVADDIKIMHHPKQSSGGYSPNVNSYFKDIENGLNEDLPSTNDHRMMKQINTHSYNTTWNIQRASTASSESSVDILSHSYHKHKDKNFIKTSFNVPSASQSRDHDAIPEEAHEDHIMERTATSIDYDGSSSMPRSTTTTDMSNDADGALLSSSQRRYQDYQNSYSDNEKQLIEQMKRMKKEHSHILRTYEDRINKLMAKMHELRNIAEMLENSSTKSSPYGMIPAKNGVLSFLGPKCESDRKSLSAPGGHDKELPPPLPPRPGRGNRLNPNKPLLRTDATMKVLPWARIILKDEGEEEQTTIWHTMMEPKLDSEEIERHFSTPDLSPTDGATLYDDLIIRRGRSRQQLVSIYDADRSRRIVVCMKCLRATLTDVTGTVSSLDTSQIHHDGLAELLELLTSAPDIDKILYHVRKRGAGHLDHPEYLVFELSKVDHFRDRLEFIRFRYKTQWHLFEIDQQMRELHTACDEVSNSSSLKHLLETLLSVGNHLNCQTDMGQADGYGLDILNKLKDLQDRDGKGTLLEFVLKTYCQVYENEVDIGCPTRFRLPEPSNMRHAAQVSFEGIQDALSNLHADLRHVREKLLDPKVNKDTTRPMDSFRVTAENFFAAALEVIGEQERILQDTRDLFHKTVAYYIMDKRETFTPQQFFQVWAIFLHDCKYFWKLAHRRLAKERFELEFKYKGQSSACSLHGYGGFKAGVMQGLESTRPSDPKTSTGQRQLNKWMANLEDGSRPSVPPKPSRVDRTGAEHVDNTDHVVRSPSPKPLTSTPPTSGDVHKPLPKAPIVTPANIQNNTLPLSPNYENQSEYDRMLTRQANPDTISSQIAVEIGQRKQATYQTHSKEKKQSQQFSLKTWLRREREQVRRDVENEDTNNETRQDSKPQSPSKSFSKLKNSMFQRFSGNSSAKKETSSKRSRHADKSISQPQNNQDLVLISPYDVLGNSAYPIDTERLDSNEVFKDTTTLPLESPDGEYNRSINDVVISPIDDPDNEEIHVPLHQVQKYAHNRYGIVKPEVRATDDNENIRSDVNNNDKVKQITAWQHDNDVKDLYGRVERGHRHNDRDNNASYNNDGHMVSPGAESKRVTAQSVPVYKAKIINNYENQGKFESTNAIRQQAEPIPQSNNNNYTPGYQKYSDTHKPPNPQTEMYTPFSGSNTNYNERLAQSNPLPVYNENNRNQSRVPHSEQVPYTQSSRYNRKPDQSQRDVHETPKKPSRVDNPIFYTPGTRAPMNVQSIGSLIDKFDKYNNNETQQPTVDETAPELPDGHPSTGVQQPPVNMTSTPVAPRKGLSNGDISEASPPLPPRSNYSDKAKFSPNNSSIQQETPSRAQYTSPYGRTNSGRVQNGRIDNEHLQGYKSTQSTPQTFNSPKSAPYNNNYNYNTPSTSNTTPLQTNFSSTGTNNMSYQSSRDKGFKRNLDFNSQPDDDLSSVQGRIHDNHGNRDVRDDGYRAQLRRAANNSSSAFDRYSKLSPQTNFNGSIPNGSIQTQFTGSPQSQYTGRPSIGSVHHCPASTAIIKPSVHNNEEVAYMAF